MKAFPVRKDYLANWTALIDVRNPLFPQSAFARAVLVVLLLGFATGLYAISAIFIHGPALLDATDYIPWGILISTYVFFVLTSTGLCFVSSLGHVFGIEKYEAISKRAVFLAIVCMLSGFVALVPDLGRPERMLFYLLTPNFTSLLWWMGFLYFVYLLFMIAEFLCLHMGIMHSAQIMGVGGVVAAIVAHSTLGGVFGVIIARPFFFGALMPIYFLLTAFLSGLAAIALASIVTPWLLGKTMDAHVSETVKGLGKLLVLFLGIALIVNTWKMLVGLYAPADTYREIYGHVVSSWLWQVEVAVGLVIPFGLVIAAMWVKRSIPYISAASTLVLVGLFIGRYDMVVAGQILPLKALRDLKFGIYAPSPVELLSVFAAFVFCALLYVTGERFLALAGKRHVAHRQPLVEREAIQAMLAD